VLTANGTADLPAGLHSASHQEIAQEISAMREIGHHPNVASLLDVVWLRPDRVNPQGQAVLVLELAAGGALFDHLVEEGAYSEEYAANIVRQVAMALYHLHSRGVVHRDIKPENVCLESDEPGQEPVVKLIDFGTALALGDEPGQMVSASAKSVGTQSYWAPEQANQQAYDFAIDMYALGVMLYILLSGFHPFDPEGDASTEQILSNMSKGKLSFAYDEWDGVSPKAKELVKSLLCPDPSKRLTAPELVAHPWVRGEDVPVAPLPATHERLRAFTRARNAFYGSLLMGILAQHLSCTCVEGLEMSGRAYKMASEADRAFDAYAVGFRLFDKESKGYIDAQDMRRVCTDMGYQISDSDISSMISVMAPTQAKAGVTGTKITFERYQASMQASFTRHFSQGKYIFQSGDKVDCFYVITKGRCDVLVPTSSTGLSKEKQQQQQRRGILQATATRGYMREDGQMAIAQLGPGDFFGETGILEGRATRAASVLCNTDVEVVAIDKATFNQVAGEHERKNQLGEALGQKAEARQRSRLVRVLKTCASSAMQQVHCPKGEVLYRQGDPATHFYIVNSGELEMVVASTDGAPVEIRRLKAGDHFGYGALLKDACETSVECLTDCSLTAVPKRDLVTAAQNDGSGYLRAVAVSQRERRLQVMRRRLAEAGGSPPSDAAAEQPASSREDWPSWLKQLVVLKGLAIIGWFWSKA